MPYDSLQQAQSLTKQQPEGVVTIEKFLENQLNIETNVQVYQRLFFININLLNSLSNKQLKTILVDPNNKKLSATDRIMAEIHIILSEPADSDDGVQSLLTTTKSDEFKATLCGHLWMPISSEQLTATQKQLLTKYLEQNKDFLTSREAFNMGCGYKKALANLK